jgi:LysR family transcriptional regulator (chromosome initiation inhibitor)
MLRAPHVIYGERDYMAVGFYRKVVRGYSKGTPQIHHVPSPQGIVRFAVDGLASALLPEYSIQPMLQDGRLVDLLPDKPFLLPLYWQTQTLQTGVTAKMSDSIVSHAKRVLLS